MPHTPLLSILLDKDFKLPYLEIDDRKSFLYHYDIKMDLYLEKIESLKESDLGKDQNKLDFITRLQTVVVGIRETLLFYLDGFPAKAYLRFKELIEESNLDNELINIRTVELPRNTNFYRIKKEYNLDAPEYKGKFNGIISSKKISTTDLLHIPFENRKAVPSNRFSIPGFPCVYLSDSLQTSWSECSLSLKDGFHAISFINHRPLYVADLVPLTNVLDFSDITNAKLKSSEIYQTSDLHLVIRDYSFLYPLISSCHTKIKYVENYANEVKFKSEYIIPQLLLQWYREQDLVIDGIRYLSCTAEAAFPKSSFSKFNYVIPVVSSSEKGHCNSLIYNFSNSPIFSYLNNPVSRKIEPLVNKIISTLKKESYKPLK